MTEMKLVVLMGTIGLLMSRLSVAMTASFLQYEQRLAQENFDQVVAQALETTAKVRNVDIHQK
jgi:hypothetical protein